MEIQNFQSLGRPYTVKDVAKLLGVSDQIIRRQAQSLGGIRIGRKYMFYERPLFEILSQRLNAKKSEDPEKGLVLPGFSILHDKSNIEDRHGLLA